MESLLLSLRYYWYNVSHVSVCEILKTNVCVINKSIHAVEKYQLDWHLCVKFSKKKWQVGPFCTLKKSNLS